MVILIFHLFLSLGVNAEAWNHCIVPGRKTGTYVASHYCYKKQVTHLPLVNNFMNVIMLWEGIRNNDDQKKKKKPEEANIAEDILIS